MQNQRLPLSSLARVSWVLKFVSNLPYGVPLYAELSAIWSGDVEGQ